MNLMKENIPLKKRNKRKFKWSHGRIDILKLIDEFEIEDDRRIGFRFWYNYKDLSYPESRWISGQLLDIRREKFIDLGFPFIKDTLIWKQ